MVDGKKMGKGLLEGMNILKGIGLALGGLLVVLIVALLIVGVLTESVADGNIPVSGNATSGITGAIIDLETTATTNVTNIVNNIPLIIGLVALVVVLAVIGWLVFKNNGKGSSGVEF